jgi:ribonuclease R
LTGTIKRNPDGFGFLIPDKADHPDVYIPRSSMDGIMTSDKVMIQVEPERGGERFRGEIVKVVERGIKRVVGQYFILNEKFGIIKDEGKGWGMDLKIPQDQSAGAKKGELVSAAITSYPDDKNEFIGKVTDLLGDAADPMMDIKRVLLTNNIPHQFSEACRKQAEKMSEDVGEADMKGRRDLRPLKFITIDGATAKDFDDAIYVETNQQGFLLYVAIADVSHYVDVGGPIDEDAYERGTSVYYPNHVTPMLPEILSNGLCSLKPNVPRLALVAEMQMDYSGKFIKNEFYEAVIQSQARVTYGEAQDVVDGNKVSKLSHVEDEIKRAADLANVLMSKRFREGSLDLEIPETQMVIDAGGNPIDVIRSERLFAHRLIEEMMLAANVAVAEFLSSRNVPALYRIHEEPNPDAITMLQKYMMNFGGQRKLQQGNLQKQLTQALQDFEGKPEALVLNILTLRSMAQAKYSPNNVGHFGLGFQNYTHFTSPIRRYPDLIVHRLIKNQIMPKSKYRLMSEEDLATAGTMLSACEQRAVKSERQLISIKKARFMHRFLGQEFDGLISSVTKFGAFVLLRQYEIDGLVRLENLGQEKYEKFDFDEDNLRLVSSRSGQAFTIGDTIKIRVISVDIEAGQINFEHVVTKNVDASGRKPAFQRPLKQSKDQKDQGHQKKKSGKNPFYSKFKKKGSKDKRRGQGKKRR